MATYTPEAKTIIEHAAAKRGQIFYRKGADGPECVVHLELEGQERPKIGIIPNSVLTDHVTILTEVEKDALFSALKKCYEYVRDNPGD